MCTCLIHSCWSAYSLAASTALAMPISSASYTSALCPNPPLSTKTSVPRWYPTIPQPVDLRVPSPSSRMDPSEYTSKSSSAFLHPLGAPDIDNLWGQSFAVLRQGGVKNGSIFSPISGQYVNLAVRLSCVSFVPFFTCAFVLGGSGGGFPI
ncbi:hypothetical protein H2248_012582 [Termitomyces sp. 'cryptogamus']|nr:hypothetical protein H2248_012582 [Termitomyces sp. 'cryptogamus']